MSSREIDGKTLTLSASGWTYNYRFVLFDYETESLWFCLGEDSCELTCVSGKFKDQKLQKMDWSITTWQIWKSIHDSSKYMKPQ